MQISSSSPRERSFLAPGILEKTCTITAQYLATVFDLCLLKTISMIEDFNNHLLTCYHADGRNLGLSPANGLKNICIKKTCIIWLDAHALSNLNIYLYYFNKYTKSLL